MRSSAGEEDHRNFIELALKEDLDSEGDVTSSAILGDDLRCTSLISKGSGVLAGSGIFGQVFRCVDAKSEVHFLKTDGDWLKPSDTVAQVKGRAAALLSAERVAMNFISFLSGIATTTREFVEEAKRHGKAQILDTRKTLPGFRTLSKYAVRVGGGRNHRMGLFDMVLIKDNHIDLSGSITAAVKSVRMRWGNKFKVEVECRDQVEVRAAVGAKVDIIMLDNMDIEQIKKAQTLIPQEIKIEVSGNIDFGRIKELSDTGIDYISVGRITHSVQSFDFSLIAADQKVP